MGEVRLNVRGTTPQDVMPVEVVEFCGMADDPSREEQDPDSLRLLRHLKAYVQHVAKML